MVKVTGAGTARMEAPQKAAPGGEGAGGKPSGGDAADAAPLPEDVLDDLGRRLRRIEGQVQGLQRMLAEGRDCREVVTQMSAALHAFQRTGFTLLAATLAHCLEHPEEAAAHGYSVKEIEQLFVRLS